MVNARGGPRRIAVLGGGVLGLSAALRLAQAGQQVVVFEREPQLGGLAVGFKVGGSNLEKFYHHIFRTDRAMIRVIDEVGLSSRLIWGKPVTSMLWDDRIADLDGPLGFLKFPFLPLADRLRWIACLALLKLAPNEKPFVGQTALDWTRRMTGPNVQRVVWEPLLRGKFADRADQIVMTWLWSRFHERSLSLGYLRGGFQQLYEALGTHIARLGGRVHLSTTVTAIRPQADGSVLVESDRNGAERFDQVLVTLPTRLFGRVAPDVPPGFLERYPGPEHFGAHVVILGLDRKLTEHVYWLNVNQPGFPFLALVEHTNFLPPEDYGGLHLVYLGNYLPMDHPLFGRDDAEVVSEFGAAVQRINPAFDPSWIRQSWVFKAPFAQPIVTAGYLDTLPPHDTPLPNVYLANMAHVYPQDRGQNYSLLLGERMARHLLRAHVLS
ncbi:MAG: NAD(P)/FAD-dependent oxidoreductase [Chloroflexi bacterium]|nr:NAD(P)/FAD-dependent oxidoreductase [Chloroflexota bacterium]